MTLTQSGTGFGGTSADTEYVLAGPGRAYIAYSTSVNERLGLKGMTAGAYSLTGLDCATGKTVE